MRRRLALLVSLLGLTALLPAMPADGAGMQTHAWMAVTAIDKVQDGQLQALLRANIDQVRLGGRFPDGGYFPGNTYGEEAHWQRFADAYLGILRSKSSCGDLTRPNGPCAKEIAFLFGVIAHGTGDEVWDWLFEPNSPDHDEYYDNPEISSFNSEGGQELTMDLIGLGYYGIASPKPAPELPSIPVLSAAFAAAGMPGIDPTEFDTGRTVVIAGQDLETQWAVKYAAAVAAAMPWMSHHLVDGPGGVQFAATSIAGQWDHQWARLLGRDEPTTVSNHYPADDDRGIPATGWVRTYLPGSDRGRGGARTRIMVSVTDALPFGRAGGPAESTLLPAGSMTITDESTGDPVPIMDGYPKAVPYGAGAGTHSAAVQPAVDLTPCTWYRVDTTEALLDADGDAVTPTSFRFRTGRDAAGTRCDGDPAAPPTTALPTTTTAPVVTTSTVPATTAPATTAAVAPIRAVAPATAAAPVAATPTYTG